MPTRIRTPTQILSPSPCLTATTRPDDVEVEIVQIDIERLEAIARQLQNGNLKTREGTIQPRSGSGRILRAGVEQSSSNE